MVSFEIHFYLITNITTKMQFIVTAITTITLNTSRPGPLKMQFYWAEISS
jgi:hypothetical protein